MPEIGAANSGKPRSTSPKKTRGRPVVHEDAWRRVTVVLLNRQIVFLDRLCSDIRAESGAAVSRAEVIRALVDMLAESNLELTGVTQEEEIKNLILSHLNGAHEAA